jgi:hypothetical protein
MKRHAVARGADNSAIGLRFLLHPATADWACQTLAMTGAWPHESGFCVK